MADTLVPTHPLESWRSAFAALNADPDVEVLVETRALLTTLDLRIDPDDAGSGRAVADAARLLGGDLPGPHRWTEIADGRAFRLGPDEWLVTHATARGDRWERALRTVLVPRGGAATDVSAQRISLRVSGPDARALLSFGCALDLRPRSFPPGHCAQTLLAHVGVLLAAEHTGDPGHGDVGYELFVRTSFAGHLAAWLLDAAVGLRSVRPA